MITDELKIKFFDLSQKHGELVTEIQKLEQEIKALVEQIKAAEQPQVPSDK
jgi:outer membrane murein-binding lipoprotein Lpp